MTTDDRSKDAKIRTFMSLSADRSGSGLFASAFLLRLVGSLYYDIRGLNNKVGLDNAFIVPDS